MADRARRATLVDELDEEWRRLCSDAAANAAARSWRLCGEDGRGLGSLAEILAATEDRCALAAANELLMALVGRARIGDGLAARVVLQRVLGPLVSQAVKRAKAARRPARELQADYVGAAWWLICEYPLERRPGSVAVNVVLDAVGVVAGYQAQSAKQIMVRPELLARVRWAPCADVDGRPLGSEPPAELLAEELLDCARRDGVSEAALELLIELHAHRRPRWHVAREHGRSTRSVAKWRTAAERDVRAAIARAGHLDA